jgi:hypothetical protein
LNSHFRLVFADGAFLSQAGPCVLSNTQALDLSEDGCGGRQSPQKSALLLLQ